jgi:glycosyltransferase involved in cell wall biosynthesis
LAVGKPVVCCAAGELKKMITAQDLGVVVNPADHEALAMAIIDLYKDAVKREMIGKRGREFVCDNFSHQAVISKWTDVMDRYSKVTN